jgi:uncharacterized RDD family membrane protein YckC
MSDDRVFIETPENLILEAEVAGFGTRSIAAVLDYLILFGLLFVLFVLFARSLSDSQMDEGWATAIFVLVQFVLISFYHLIFELVWQGQTPGKRWVGIRVVQAGGLPLTTAGAVIRNIVRLFDFLPLFYGIGLLAMFVSPRVQRLGDLAANTIVIRERRGLALTALRDDYTVGYEVISRYDAIPGFVDVTALDEDDRRTIVDFLRRRATLPTREHVAVLLAGHLAEKMGHNVRSMQLDNPRRAEAFLEFTARAFELSQQDENATQR